METAHNTYFTVTSPLVSVLFVPSLHSYYFSRKFLFFSSIYIHRAVGPDPAVISPTLICASGCDSYFDREGIHQVKKLKEQLT